MVELILKHSSAPIHFDRVYETDMAEGLKAMALEGHGVAFLPFSAVRKDLRARKLVSAAPPELKDLSITMEVRAYRERPTHREALKPGHPAGRPGVETHKHNAQALWDYLITHYGAL
jgi:DNA-binding transcriptional LysR family regulator